MTRKRFAIAQLISRAIIAGSPKAVELAFDAAGGACSTTRVGRGVPSASIANSNCTQSPGSTGPLPFKTQVDGRAHVAANAAPHNTALPRGIVLLATAMLTVWGIYAVQRTPLDALP